MSQQTNFIIMDAEPNSMKNRLIRLIENWEIIKKQYKIKTDRDMLLHIVNRMFKSFGVIAA